MQSHIGHPLNATKKQNQRFPFFDRGGVTVKHFTRSAVFAKIQVKGDSVVLLVVRVFLNCVTCCKKKNKFNFKLVYFN